MLQLVEGSVFHGRYRIVRLIKAGGMGAVYEAVDVRSDRRRALKVLLPSMMADEDVRARFDREARLTGTIESDHLVEVSDAGVDPETNAPFIAMELLRGQDVESLLRQVGRASPADVVALLAQAALALDKTHAAGIVHRDLKPDNLFITRREDGTVNLKVLDFGAAKKVATTATGAGSTRVLGTPLYMPPEQALGRPNLGPPVDLYALGHIAYVLLVGSHYWREEQRSMDVLPFLIRSSTGNPDPASARAQRAGVWLPPAFDAWFARATAVDPGARFPSASEMISALGFSLGVSRVAPLVAGIGIVPSPLSTSQPMHNSNAPTPSSAFTTSNAAQLTEAPVKPLNWPVLIGAAVVGLGIAIALGLTLRGFGKQSDDPKPAVAATTEDTTATATAPGPNVVATSSATTEARVAEPSATSTAGASATTSVGASRASATAVVSSKPVVTAASAKPRPSSTAATTSSSRPRTRGEGLF